MTNKILLLLLLLLIAGGVWYFFARPAEQSPNQDITPTGVEDTDTTPGGERATTTGTTEQGVVIRYTETGFSPSSVTVPQGTTVRFSNETSQGMWVASAQHPTHSVYSGSTLSEHCPDTQNTTFDQCETGDTYQFTFEKTGTWNYHNHVAPNDFGSVVVE